MKYTYGGDANLDGKLNIDDYGRIDFNIQLATTGYFNGDFNYDGRLDVDDYGIIDFNVGIQGAPITSASATRAEATAVQAIFGHLSETNAPQQQPRTSAVHDLFDSEVING